MAEKTNISKLRLFTGAAILIIGFCAPLFIPLVTATAWSIGFKTTISGLLAFGIPEVFMLIAVAVMGKQGYEFIKQKALRYLKRFAPPDTVNITRYRIGLVMFSLPLLFGWLQPYLGHFIDFFEDAPTWFYIISDIVFVTSLFVLGGDFWDKFSGLFKYEVKINKKPSD